MDRETGVLRWRLAARREDCFDRLDDAVSELCALHSVVAAEILARVHATIESERSPPGSPRSAAEPLEA